MRPNNRGFTLVETLLVLTAFLTLTAIGFTLPSKSFQQQEVNQFLNRFQHDVLYLQSINMYEDSAAYMTINPDIFQYTIQKSGSNKAIIKRDIPRNWKIYIRTLTLPISYTPNGTIKNPGSFVIETEKESYKVVFPFGKGRSYIEKQ